MQPSPSPTSDASWAEATLVEGVRAGDERSCEQLARGYGGRMLAVIRRIVHSEEDAQDCLQEAFLQVFRGIDAFEARSALGTWLNQIAVNAALMSLRRRRRPEDPITDLLPRFDADGCRIEEGNLHSPPTESIHEQEETAALVRRAIMRLPESHRIVLMLRDIDGYSTEETATLLEISPGAAKIRLHRARAALKTLLERMLSGDPPS